MGSLRQDYGSDQMDELFVYFMKTILRMQKHGLREITLDCALIGPVAEYVRKAMLLIGDAQPRAVFRLILDAELNSLLQSGGLSREEVLQLTAARQMAEMVAFSDLDGFSELENLWQDKANGYACRTYYAALPEEFRKSQGLDRILEHLPESMLRPDDF